MLRQANLWKGFTTGTLEMDSFCGTLSYPAVSMYDQTEDTAFPWPIRNHAEGSGGAGLLRLKFIVV